MKTYETPEYAIESAYNNGYKKGYEDGKRDAVKHGNWVYYSTTMQECSNCKRHTARHKFKYCPHCGAVMGDKLHYAID